MHCAWMNRNDEVLTIPLDTSDYFSKVLPYIVLKYATFAFLCNRDDFTKWERYKFEVKLG